RVCCEVLFGRRSTCCMDHGTYSGKNDPKEFEQTNAQTPHRGQFAGKYRKFARVKRRFLDWNFPAAEIVRRGNHAIGGGGDESDEAVAWGKDLATALLLA